MPHDTLVGFEMRRRQGGEPAQQRYQPAMSLQNGDLVAIRALHYHDFGAEAQTWPDVAAVWFCPPTRALANPNFPGELRARLSRLGVSPARVCLELTEAAAMAITADGLLKLSALRDIGVGLILTDFGGAVASLTALKRLPLTAMTLSSVLVRAVPADREDAGLVRAAITAAHTLGLAVIADGIASSAQSIWLGSLDCAAGLGPLFGAPMSTDRLGNWLDRTCQPDPVAAIRHGD